MDVAEALKRLAEVRTLTFEATSQARVETGWRGNGSGTVRTESPQESVLLFHEEGEWSQEGGRRFRFRNVFRWAAEGGTLRLAHLRFGPEKPVHLFELAAVDAQTWASAEAHLCQDDCYRARLEFADEVRLCWTVVGPAKQETIRYTYR